MRKVVKAGRRKWWNPAARAAMSARHRRRRFIANVAGWGVEVLQRRGVPSLVIRRVGIFDGFLPANIEWREQGSSNPPKAIFLPQASQSLFTKARTHVARVTINHINYIELIIYSRVSETQLLIKLRPF